MIDDTAGEVDADTPVNPYSLLDAVNRSSDMAHTGWLIFLGVMAYLMIAVAGVTHTDLLLEKSVQLPIFGIQIPQIQFFQFAPVLLVLFHLGIVSQLVLLARKTLEFDFAVQQLEASSRRTHPLRLELHNFFFVQGIAGSDRSIIMGAFLHAMSWLTLVVIPVILLLFIQIKFLPYHDVQVTWSHRIALLLDITMMIMIGVFLIRPEASFWRAVWRTMAHYPVGFVVTAAVFIMVSLFSFFVATIPDETLDRWVQKARANLGFDTASAGSGFVTGFSLPFLAVRSDGSLFGIFYRNLVVPDVDLVPNKTVTKGEPSLNLRDRDLRYAVLDRSDLHQADLTGANLDGASLVGADLRDVRLQCADVTLLILTDDRETARCASARNADLSRAVMTRAMLVGSDLRGAKFEEARLSEANLSYSLIAGGNFSSANLEMANITGGAQAQGANFLIASLEGADLTGAQLQFADFSSAALQGTLLAHAHLQSAVLRDANLEGADLQRARLQAADLTGAELKGADLRWARVWMTQPPPETALALADLSEIRIAELDANEVDALKTSVSQVIDVRLRKLISQSLRPLVEPSKSRKWRTSDAKTVWEKIVSDKTVSVGDTLYKSDLTAHLSTLACRKRWLNGSVATGIARRARGQNFRGNLPEIVTALRAPACSPGGKVDDDLMQEIAIAAGR